MVSTLNESQLPVPPSATLLQIRQLYENAALTGEVMSARKLRANRVVLEDAPIEEPVMATAAPHGEELGDLQEKPAVVEINEDDPAPPLSLPETAQANLESFVGRFSGDDDDDIGKWPP